MVWGAIIGAAASLAGGYAQNAQQSGASTDQRHFAREMWQKQLEQDNKAIYRQTKDLRRAGLNPILAAKGGGANTPSSQGYQTPQYKDIISPAVNTALTARANQATQELQETQGVMGEANIKRTYQDISNMKEAQKLTKEQTEQVALASLHIQLQMEQTKEQTKNLISSTKMLDENTAKVNMENRFTEIWTRHFNENEALAMLHKLGLEGTAAKTGLDLLKKSLSAIKQRMLRNAQQRTIRSNINRARSSR